MMVEVLAVANDLGLPVERLSGHRLAVKEGPSRVVLSCVDEEIRTLQLVRPWTPSSREAMAVRQGERAPTVEALLEELNRKNHERLYAL